MLAIMRRARRLALVLAALIGVQTAVAGVAQAGLIGTEAALAQNVAGERERLVHELARSDVRDALAAYGIDPAEAEARVAAMSDVEIATLAETIGEEPAGGLLGVVVIAGLIGLIVVLVAHATGQSGGS